MRYLPNVIDTTCTLSGTVVGPSRPISPSSHRHTAFGLAPGSRAALRNPCGFIQISSWPIETSSGDIGTGVPPAPSTCQP